MADERVNFVIAAQDRATATVRRLKGELNTMGGAAATATGPMGRLSAATGGLISPVGLAIGGTIALGAAFLGAARAAMDEERGVALLTTAIRENDPANVSNIASIERTIRERQKLAFADDEQRESLGALIAITRDSDKALELQRTAMDLARLKGMDLADATTLIGKVYGGNIGILARYGIQLERGTTATEAIAEIQRRAAGQAEAFANTTAGAMQSMMLVFDDVVEDIGAELLPTLTSLAIYARDELIPAIRDLGEVVGGPLRFAFEAVTLPLRTLITLFVETGKGVADFAMNFGDQGTRVHALADKLGVDFDVMKKRITASMEESGASFETTTAAMENDAALAAINIPDRMSEAVRGGADAIRLGGPVVAAEAGRIAGMLPSEISARVEDIKQAGRDSVLAFATGVLEQRMSPLNEAQALVAAMDATLSEAEIAAGLTGEDVTKAIETGMASGDPALVFAARSLVSNTVATLDGMGQSGWDAGQAFVNNLGWSINQHGTATDAARRAAGAIRAVFPFSEPKDPRSPLRGWSKYNPLQGVYENMAASAGEAGAAARAGLSGIGGMLGGFGGAMAPAFAGGGGFGGGVTEVHTHLYLDGKQIAENVTRHQYYANPAGASVLPRGT